MFDFYPCTLGLGVMLAWAVLPVLVWVARRGRAGGPGPYYSMALLLGAAVAVATSVLFTPRAVEASKPSWPCPRTAEGSSEGRAHSNIVAPLNAFHT